MLQVLCKPVLKQLHRAFDSPEVLDAAVPRDPGKLRFDRCCVRGSVGAFTGEDDDFVDEIDEAFVCELGLFTKREFCGRKRCTISSASRYSTLRAKYQPPANKCVLSA